jgi:plastocyanin
MKTLPLLSMALAVSLLVAGATAAVPAQDTKIEITAKGFTPVIVEVNVGQKVIWMNATDAEHTVTEGKHPKEPQDGKKTGPLFDSGKIKPGGTFEFTFTQPGTYTYGCSLDASMVGKIAVKPRP